MNKTQNVLVIAAHPDDEILGVAGTIKRHTLSGHNVHSIVVCEGSSIRYKGQESSLENCGIEASKILGSSIEFLNYPDQGLENIPLTEVISEIEKGIKKHQPSIIYTQFGGDLNLDHKRLFEAVLVAARPISDYVRHVLAFDTASSTEWGYPQMFQPGVFIDIKETLETKIEAFKCYESEKLDWPHPRSVEGLINRAKYYGSIANMEAAEPFVLIRSSYPKGELIL